MYHHIAQRQYLSFKCNGLKIRTSQQKYYSTKEQTLKNCTEEQYLGTFT